MRARVASGELHPMKVLPDLGRSIVTDFHSAIDADCAQEIFNRVVQQKEIPNDIPVVPMPDEVKVENGIRVDRLLARAWLDAESNSDAIAQDRGRARSILIGERVIRRMAYTGPTDDMLIQGQGQLEAGEGLTKERPVSVLAIGDNLKLSADSIRAHKLRASLTVLGLTMGVATLITVAKGIIVRGRQHLQVEQKIANLGTNVFRVARTPFAVVDFTVVTKS